jgi:hypothetical protein
MISSIVSRLPPGVFNWMIKHFSPAPVGDLDAALDVLQHGRHDRTIRGHHWRKT